MGGTNPYCIVLWICIAELNTYCYFSIEVGRSLPTLNSATGSAGVGGVGGEGGGVGGDGLDGGLAVQLLFLPLSRQHLSATSALIPSASSTLPGLCSMVVPAR